MSLVGVFSQSRPNIEDIYFDAVLEESSELVSDVSEFPLEDGSVGHDHAVVRPLRLTMTVGISDNKFRALRAAASETAAADALTTGRGQLTGIGAGAAVGAVAGRLSGGAAALAGLAASVAGQLGTNRSQGVLEKIRELQREGALLTVVAAKGGAYQNMLITRTYQQTTKQNEGGLELVIEMVQVQLINQRERPIKINPAPGDSAFYQAQATVDLGLVPVVPA